MSTNTGSPILPYESYCFGYKGLFISPPGVGINYECGGNNHGGFRTLVDAATAELADRGYEDVRPVHDFAMRAIAAGADSASELGRSLSITKQSAARTIAVLQERGYVARDTDPRDARRKRLQVTELGFDVLRQGEAIFDELRDQWAERIGATELEGIEDHLTALAGAQPVRLDTPGWIARDVGEPA